MSAASLVMNVGAYEKDYSNQNLAAVPSAVTKRKRREKITALRLDRNRIRIVPPAFAFMRNLLFLDLTANRIERMPEPILQLDRLRDLRISKNPSTLQMYTSPMEMPDNWGNLAQTLARLEWPVVNQYEVERFLELERLSRLTFTVAIVMTPRNSVQVRTTNYREVSYPTRADARRGIESEAFLLTTFS